MTHLLFASAAALLMLAAGCQQAAQTPAPPTIASKAPASAPTVAPAPTAPAPAATVSAPATPAAATKPTAAPVAVKPAGKIVVAVTNLGEQATMPQEGAVSNHSYWSPMYEFLNYQDKDGNMLPGLATKWDISADHLTWTIHLQPGVKFHSGDDFTADDVKYTLELLMDPKSLHMVTPSLRGAIDRIDVVDPLTLSVHTKQPFSTLQDLMSDMHTPPIVSKKYIDRVGMDVAREKPMGTGPFKFVERNKGEFIRFEAVENHWRKTPAIKDLEERIVPEDSTRLAMLRRGEAHIVELPLSFKKEAQAANIRALSLSGFGTTRMALTGQYADTRPGFDPNLPTLKKEVRQALNFAVNRQEIADHVFYGEAIPANQTFPLPGLAEYDSTLKPYPYDPAKAKQLLADAGYPNGFSMEIKSYPRPGVPDLAAQAEAVAQYWQAIGVKTTITPSDSVAVRSILSRGDKAGFATQDVHARVGAAMAWGFYATGTGAVYETERMPELKTQINAAFAEFDPQKRTDMLKAFTRVLYDNYIQVPLVTVNAFYGLSNKIDQWPTKVHYGPTGFEYITTK